MAGTKTIHDYSAAVSIDASNDYLLIDPSSSGNYNKINRNTLLGLASAPLGLTDSQSPTNKVFNNTNSITVKDGSFTLQNTSDTTKQGVFSLSGLTTGTTRTYTLPNFNATLATLAGTETLTNKTITSPAITGGTIDNASITVDSIQGHSSSTVVTVGGVQMNNGVINTASAVTSTSIATGAVQPQALQSGTGTGWATGSFTPSWTNLTVGNGTNSGYYIQMGKMVFGYIIFVLGTTSSVGTVPTFTPPVTASAKYLVGSQNYRVGNAWLSAAGSNYEGSISYNSGGLYINYFTGSPPANTNVTASAPGVWATGNYLNGWFMYEAA